MRKILHLIFVIAFTFGLVWLAGLAPLEAQVREVIQAPREERPTQLWTFLFQFQGDTTRLFQSLDSIGAAAKSEDDGLLYWTVEFLRLESRKHHRYKLVPQRIAYLKSRQQHFEQSPYPVIRATFYHTLGNAYFTNFNFPESFKFLLRARRMFEQIGYENVPQAPKILNDYFFFHYYFGDYRTAIEYSELTEKYNQPELVGEIYLLSNRGEANMKLRDYEKAKELFLRAIKLAEARSKKPFWGIANGNYGNALRLQGSYAEALPYLYKDVAINEKRTPKNAAISCLYISYCLLKLDSVTKARAYIDRSRRLTSVTSEQNLSEWHWAVYGTTYYEVQALYAQKTGSLSTALMYKDSLLVLNDSLDKVFDNKLLLKAQAQQAADNYLREVRAMEQEKADDLFKRSSIIAVTFVVALLLIFLLDYRRLREKQLRELEKKRDEELLARANEQLMLYVENIQKKNALIEKISADLAYSSGLYSKQTEEKDELAQLRRKVILTEESWQDFKELFQRVYPKFFDRLEAMPADFSPAEIRLLALLRLQISSRQAANMLGISVDSLRKARYRLRKKVEILPADFRLSDLIGSD